MKILFILALTLEFFRFSPVAFAAESSHSIYGTDSREDVYQITDPELLKHADASVALFYSWDLGSDNNGKTSVTSTPLKTSQNLCAGQAFENQPTSPYCSGALIAPDIVMTAGHCAKSSLLCLGIKVAFGFEVTNASKMPTNLKTSDVYHCKEIIHTQDADGEPDFSLIRLDRTVVGHTPAQIDRAADQHVGDPVVLVGYPSGLPLKIAGDATIRSVAKTSFVSDVDAFADNSGSPVFNVNTGLIEGILVDGDPDYVKPSGQSCNVAEIFTATGGDGETATSVSAVIPYLDAALNQE